MAKATTYINYTQRVNDVTRYIDEYYADKITLNTLSKIANLSSFHFSRVFQSCTGLTPGNFLQHHRLLVAYKLIRTKKNYNVLDIALQVGYENQSSFSRAFRKQFGIAPMASLDIELDHLQRRSGKKFTSDQNETLTTDYITLPDFSCYGIPVAGYSQRSFIKSAKPAFNKLLTMVASKGIDLRINNIVGILLDNPGLIDNQQCRFVAAIKSTEKLPLPELESFPFDAGHWVIFEHKGAYTTLWQTWYKIYGSWIIKNGISVRDTPAFEVYITPPETPDQDKRTLIHMPVVYRN